MPRKRPPRFRFGTCSWTGKGWVGSFYPDKTKQADFLAYYCTQFDSVEIDSTFYGVPKADTVRKWADSVPDDFRFAAKFPRTITHQKSGTAFQPPADYESDLTHFIETMAGLGAKQGPLLLQFPYYKVRDAPELEEFTDAIGGLLGFLRANTDGLQLAVEVRNKGWLKPDTLLDCLREHNAALALIHHPYMSPKKGANPLELYDPLERFHTADFGYIRLLGDRYAIERRTKVRDTEIIDRSEEIELLVAIAKNMQKLATNQDIYSVLNNHFSGHAPATVRKVIERLEEEGYA